MFFFSGRKFDLNGNLNQWWSNKSSLEFDKRTECFVNQYSNYYLPSINETVKCQSKQYN